MGFAVSQLFLSFLVCLVLNLFTSVLWGREEIFTRKIFFLQVMSCHFLVANWYQFVCVCVCVAEFY